MKEKLFLNTLKFEFPAEPERLYDNEMTGLFCEVAYF